MSGKKVAVVTGGGHGIGKAIADAFRAKGVIVHSIDIKQGEWFVGDVGKKADIAEMVMFLCSEKAGFITGENICIDGGMTRQMIYHGDHGWTSEK